MRRRRASKPIERLIENMKLLEDLVDNPERFGTLILLHRLKVSKSKIPTNINLLDFKIKMEVEIRRISRKIERKLGFQLPDGLK